MSAYINEIAGAYTTYSWPALTSMLASHIYMHHDKPRPVIRFSFYTMFPLEIDPDSLSMFSFETMLKPQFWDMMFTEEVIDCFLHPYICTRFFLFWYSYMICFTNVHVITFNANLAVHNTLG